MLFSSVSNNIKVEQARSIIAAYKAEEFVFDEPALHNLYDLLRFFEQQYYANNQSLISDYEYDILFEIVKKIENENQTWIADFSPTQRVGNDITNLFATVTHAVPMLSLNNSYNESDVFDFDISVKKLAEINEINYCVEPKFDGASIALTYEDDILIRAATRGNGIQGDDITPNAKAIRSIPLKVPFSKYGIKTIELRGEVMISQSHFAAMNMQREALRLPLYQNARNTVSGSLRLKNSAEIRDRNLEAFIYQIGYAIDDQKQDILLHSNFKSHFHNIEWLSQLGFKTPNEEKKCCTNIQEAIQFIQEWEKLRDNYAYEIDGMVIKVNNLPIQQNIGATSHHPRWAVAYKFKPKSALSKLIQIDYQVGRTGAITPVAKIEPVKLAGVTVSSVSLHNEEFIKEKQIEIGDYVFVERAGDVIPYITGVDINKRSNTQSVVFPTHCPICNSLLEKPENESVWRCFNTADCPAQIEERLVHFVSKDAMNIDGLGRETILDFVSRKVIGSIVDIYTLNYEAINQWEGWKEKRILNLKNGIEASKQNELYRLIVGLGIRHCGERTAKLLSKQVSSIFDFGHWTIEQYMALQDIGPKVAETLFAYFQDQNHISLLYRLKELGVNTINQSYNTNINDGVWSGKTILFTGTLSTMKRDDAEKLAEQHGAKIASSVSKNLSILVVGESAGSKLEKAKKINTITIWSETEFLDHLNAI